MGNRAANPPVRSAADAPPQPADGSPAPHPLVVVFDGLRDELVSTLAYMLGNRDDALDAAQDAFLKCWKARDTLPQIENIRAWVFRIGMNTARDLQRSAWHRRVRPLAGEEPMLTAPDATGLALEDQETINRLRSAIGELRPDEKEVFLLRQNGGLTYEQIAEMRNAPVGTVKTQMRTALIKLRKVLNPDAPATG